MMDTNNEMDEDNLYNRKKKRRTKDRTKGRRNIKEKKGRKMRTKKWRMHQRIQLKLQFSQLYSWHHHKDSIPLHLQYIWIPEW